MEIRAPRGNKLTCKSWQTEAAMRMKKCEDTGSSRNISLHRFLKV